VLNRLTWRPWTSSQPAHTSTRRLRPQMQTRNRTVLHVPQKKPVRGKVHANIRVRDTDASSPGPGVRSASCRQHGMPVNIGQPHVVDVMIRVTEMEHATRRIHRPDVRERDTLDSPGRFTSAVAPALVSAACAGFPTGERRLSEDHLSRCC